MKTEIIRKIENNTNLHQVLTKILIYSMIFFSLGIIYDLLVYINVGISAIILLDTITLLGIFGIMGVWKLNTISSNTALLINMFIISLNLVFSTLYHGIYEKEHIEGRIMLNMCIFIMPILFTSLTKHKGIPYIIGSIGIITYGVSIYLVNDDLLMYLPFYTLIYIGTPILLNLLVIASEHIELEKIIVTEEKRAFFRELNIEQEHIELIINPDIRNRKGAEEILDKMDRKIRDTLVEKVRDVISSEENIRNILKQRCPDITDSELEISILIVDGKTVSEICNIRHVSPSTITSTRSRLRRKLGLEDSESLKSYLTSLVNDSLINQ